MHEVASREQLPPGQALARQRWKSADRGAAFDSKKTIYLSEPARTFIAQRDSVVIAGLDRDGWLDGQMVCGERGFVQTPDRFTCLLPLDATARDSGWYRGLQAGWQANTTPYCGLFWIHHPTRERLCVHGRVEPVPRAEAPAASGAADAVCWVKITVDEAFFHCARYIKTRIPGLSAPPRHAGSATRIATELAFAEHEQLIASDRAFIAAQETAFLCTVDAKGRCGINHRGGAPGFLATLAPSEGYPGGTILLPDYAGNGAFEAIGNIFESGQALFLIPDYSQQVCLAVQGSAWVREAETLPPTLAAACPGAERIVTLDVRRVSAVRSSWSAWSPNDDAPIEQSGWECSA